MTHPTEIKQSSLESNIYEEWLYPQPIDDLKAYQASGRIDAAAPKIVHPLYWPNGAYEKSAKKHIDILIVGCGPNAAARYAFEHPEAQVTGIDISDAALAHSKMLQEKHGLENLTLKKWDLNHLEPEQIAGAELHSKFDFIEIIGVLNHLTHPVETTKRLKALLKPHGVMTVMLYGLYGRPGASMLQTLFKETELGHTPEALETVRQTLGLLDASHPVHLFNQTTFDSQFDAGLVDSFLRGVDPAYDVAGCLDFTKQVDMTFMGWLDTFNYHPEGQIPPENLLYEKIKALPDETQWKLMELFNGTLKKHTFYLCLNEREPQSYQINFEGDDFLDYVPLRRINQFKKPDKANKQPAFIQRSPYKALPLTDVQLALFANTDGKRTIKEIIEKTGLTGETDVVTGLARNFYKSLWRIGYAMFLI